MSANKRIRCFFLSPTNRAQVSLRRYHFSDWGKNKEECPGPYGYHNASVVIGECDYIKRAISVTEEMKADPQWPKVCEGCGKPFRDQDHWQWNENRLYERGDTKERTTLRDAPPGAMYDVEWFKEFYKTKEYKERPDGILLCVKTPDGDWIVDGPSNNGNGWERTGTVPDITATPSILMHKYHGWLRNGWLEEC